jgi:hypothetical protein
MLKYFNESQLHRAASYSATSLISAGMGLASYLIRYDGVAWTTFGTPQHKYHWLSTDHFFYTAGRM